MPFVVYNPGDVVKVSTIALVYQDIDDYKPDHFWKRSFTVGIVLAKNQFVEEVFYDKNDCQSFGGSEEDIRIQQPNWVYTILCEGRKIEVLDLDVTCLEGK